MSEFMNETRCVCGFVQPQNTVRQILLKSRINVLTAYPLSLTGFYSSNPLPQYPVKSLLLVHAYWRVRIVDMFRHHLSSPHQLGSVFLCRRVRVKELPQLLRSNVSLLGLCYLQGRCGLWGFSKFWNLNWLCFYRLRFLLLLLLYPLFSIRHVTALQSRIVLGLR